MGVAYKKHDLLPDYHQAATSYFLENGLDKNEISKFYSGHYFVDKILQSAKDKNIDLKNVIKIDLSNNDKFVFAGPGPNYQKIFGNTPFSKMNRPIIKILMHGPNHIHTFENYIYDSDPYADKSIYEIMTIEEKEFFKGLGCAVLCSLINNESYNPQATLTLDSLPNDDLIKYYQRLGFILTNKENEKQYTQPMKVQIKDIRDKCSDQKTCKRFSLFKN